MGLFKRKRKDDDEPVDLEERSPQLGLKWKDLLVLDAMTKQGADLNRPREVGHYLYFGSREPAEAAAREAAARGWDVRVREPLPEYPDQWCAHCTRDDAVLTPPFVRESTDYFDDLAARHGGDYDGWEAAAD